MRGLPKNTGERSSHDAFMQGLRRLNRDIPSFSVPDVEYPDEYADEFEEWEDDAEESFPDE